MTTAEKTIQLYLPRLGGMLTLPVMTNEAVYKRDKNARYMCSTWPEDGLDNEGSWDILRIMDRAENEEYYVAIN